MRMIMRWGSRFLLGAIVLAALFWVWKREEITRLMVVNTLFEADRIVQNFSNMDLAFLHRPIQRGNAPVIALPKGAAMPLPDGFAKWVEARNITALVVLHEGKLVHESYHLGTGAMDRRIGWSVAKSWLSLLLGQLLADGTIPSLDVSVVDYVPELASTAYAGASLRDVLMMRSGVEFDEDYLDPDSDINRMGRVIALGGTLDGFVAELKERSYPPGERWKYTSIDTHVVGQVIRAATKRDIVSLLGERLIGPLGAEIEPYYLTDGEGVAFVLGGINMIARDYARLGLLIAQNGMWQGRQLVPADWIEASITRSAGRAADEDGYGYQWWIPAGAGPGEVTAQGIYGQYVWIDRARQVVIVMNAADRDFRKEGVDLSNYKMFRKIASALAGR